MRGGGQPFNPFSIHRVEPGAIAFVGEGEASLDAILCRLIVVGLSRGGGQITGPHGSGKTTLLVHLHRRATELGWATSMFRAQREPIVWPKAQVQSTGETPVPRVSRSGLPRVMFIDSAEQMPRWKWAWLRREASIRGVGLVVTTHRDLGLPLLHTRRVDGACARRIVDSLIADSTGDERASTAAAADLEALLAARKGSLRDVLFTLYDRYEGRETASV